MSLLVAQAWIYICATSTWKYSYFKSLMEGILLELFNPHRIRVTCEDVGSRSDCTGHLFGLTLCFQCDSVLLEQLFQRYVVSNFSVLVILKPQKTTIIFY